MHLVTLATSVFTERPQISTTQDIRVLVSDSLELSGPRFVAENMSGRSGVGQTRGTASGPQPLKATVPYQLASKPRSHRRDGQSGMSLSQHMDHMVMFVYMFILNVVP